MANLVMVTKCAAVQIDVCVTAWMPLQTIGS
jgi:hypothetical protein